MPREEAMKAAIKYCIENNILKDFLETHSSEVFNMLLTEWNTEEAKEVWYEEGREEGRGEGREEGREEIIKLLKSGKSPEEIIREYGGN